MTGRVTILLDAAALLLLVLFCVACWVLVGLVVARYGWVGVVAVVVCVLAVWEVVFDWPDDAGVVEDERVRRAA